MTNPQNLTIDKPGPVSTEVSREAEGARLGRWALAVILPAGPLAIAILRGILPYSPKDSNTTLAARVAAHQGAESLVSWLVFIALLTIVPGVITAGLLARRRAPVLGTTGLVLSFAAVMCLFWSMIAGSDTVALGAARIGMSPAAAGRLIGSMGAIAPVSLAGNIFVAGHIIGFVLLGVALWRTRIIPAWAGLLLVISQPLHAVFAIAVPNHALDGCAWGLTAIGFAAVAAALLREPGAA